MKNIFGKARVLWNKEQIRCQVMLSLTLQLVLIFFAPLRKRSRDKRLLLLLWLAYLGADYVATLALGSILANTIDNNSGTTDLPGQILTAFWAPFLLLHLGGPDNITSYSLEDNELWWRHFLTFFAQVSVALVVLVQSMLQTTRLMVPSILIFIFGTIKFGERTLALRSASIQQIKHSKGTLKKLFADLKYTDGNGNLGAGLVDVEQGAQLNGEVSDMSDAKSILRAYICYLVFKPHIIGAVISTLLAMHHMGIRNVDRDFRFIGTELSFFYDILHTKATVVHSIKFRVIRIASFVSIGIALVFFYITNRRDNANSDIIITYILMSVALFLELYSAFHLVVSNRMIITLFRLNKKWSSKLAGFISRAKNHIPWYGDEGRWSGRMGQYSLIQSAIENEHGSSWRFKIKKAWDILFGAEKSAKVSDVLEKAVIKNASKLFEGVCSYEDFVDVVDKIRSSWISNSLDQYGLTEIKEEMEKKAFDECVIAWHMATDICYFAANAQSDSVDERQMREGIYRVSRYMMYLLLERSSMMPPGIAKIRTEETLEKSLKLLGGRGLDDRQACMILYNKVMGRELEELSVELQPYVDPLWYRESALPFVSLITKHLKRIAETENEERQWEVIRDVWMGMLTYAAVHCSRIEHARGLSAGGELLTFYWLLLAHYGVVDTYNTSKMFWFYAMMRKNTYVCP